MCIRDRAYTYGESGIGERVSVDKSEESSYYLYDGRNSVTGILTENANLTNSYQYDPYGDLTSGTADGVNYYGYNGESTNVKTGLQYPVSYTHLPLLKTMRSFIMKFTRAQMFSIQYWIPA